MKYKRDDKVRIVAERGGHGFRIGEIVKIAEVYKYKNDEHYYAVSNNDG